MSSDTGKIIVKTETNCVGCLICAFMCSYTNENEFNPSKAHIIIEKPYSLSPKIVFLDSCKKCGVCAQYCLYGALSIEGGDS